MAMLLYFIGLIILSITAGSATSDPHVGFFILGIGIIIAAIFVAANKEIDKE